MSTGGSNDLYDYYVKEPQERKGYQWFEANFPSTVALQNYLRSDPPINRDIFGYRLSSESWWKRFHGIPLQEAISYLSGGYTQGLDQLLHIKGEFDETLPVHSPKTYLKTSPIGSRFHIPNAVAGSPNYMVKPVRQATRKGLTVHFNAAYAATTSAKQIFNRGLLTLSLIDRLERNNYTVNLNVFDLSYTNKEIIYIKIGLKRHGGLLDMAVVNFIVNSKEFQRRIIFRIQETMQVNDSEWSGSYGKVFPPDKVRDLLDISKRDILIGTPGDMNVFGNNLKKDADAFFEAVQMKGYVRL